MSTPASAAPAASAAPSTAPAAAAQAPGVQPTQNLANTSNESDEVTPEEKALVESETKKQEALRKKYNLKVNGKSRDVELDLGNDEEVQKYLQKAYASDEKFEEAANMRKQMEYLINELKTNPLSVLQHEALGIDVKKLAEMVMAQELEDMQKSPEQKRIEELERKLKDKEVREKVLEDERRAAEMAKYEEQAAQQLDDQISSALSSSKLPKSPYVVKRIADAMIEAVNLGYDNVTPDQILPFVEEQITEEIQRLFEESPDEVMEKIVGKKRLDTYRKGKVTRSKIQANDTTKQIKDTGTKTGKEAKKEETEKVRFKDLFGTF